MVEVETNYCVFKLGTIHLADDKRFRVNPHVLIAVDGGWFDDQGPALEFIDNRLRDEDLQDSQYVVLPVVHVKEC